MWGWWSQVGGMVMTNGGMVMVCRGMLMTNGGMVMACGGMLQGVREWHLGALLCLPPSSPTASSMPRFEPAVCEREVLGMKGCVG